MPLPRASRFRGSKGSGVEVLRRRASWWRQSYGLEGSAAASSSSSRALMVPCSDWFSEAGEGWS